MNEKDGNITAQDALKLSKYIRDYIYEKGGGGQDLLNFLSGDLIATMGMSGVSKEAFKQFCDLISGQFDEVHDKISSILSELNGEV